jgi:mRNA interferase MazF
MKYGEIWQINFDPTIGDEIKKTRPAVIISRNGLSGLRIRLVVPITGWKPDLERLSWIIQLAPTSTNGLSKLSAANPLQTRSVSTARFVNRLGVLQADKLEEIVLALGIIVQHP